MPKQIKPPSTIDRIKAAETPREVADLVSHALGLHLATDATLRKINRAAVARNRELARP